MQINRIGPYDLQQFQILMYVKDFLHSLIPLQSEKLDEVDPPRANYTNWLTFGKLSKSLGR